LRAIFRQKARDVRDTSLTVPPGIEGTVVDVKVFSRRGVDKDERAKSIEEEEIGRLEKDYQDEIAMVEMERDQKLKNLLVGKTSLNELFDPTVKTKSVTKKGSRIERADLDNFSWNELKKIKIKEDEGLSQTIRRIEVLPEEDMPYLPDGTPVEIVLNPLGVPSRMNVGQILETHLGWAARALGLWMASPVFDGATEGEIKEHLRQANLPTSGKTALYDGRSGKKFHQEVTSGQIYILKLDHRDDDKRHDRA